MRAIIIADSLHHRYVGLHHALSQQFDINPHVDLFDSYNAKKITRKKEYNKVLVIGNETKKEMEKIDKYLYFNNEAVIIYRIIFSDVIKQRNLKQHLMINPYCLVVSGDISLEYLLMLIKSWMSGIKVSDFISVRFSPRVKKQFSLWGGGSYNAHHIAGDDLKNANNSPVSSRLKRKMNIRSDYSLYLLWCMTNSNVTYIQPSLKQINSKRPISHHAGGVTLQTA